jgi:hypothetical protein
LIDDNVGWKAAGDDVDAKVGIPLHSNAGITNLTILCMIVSVVIG